MVYSANDEKIDGKAQKKVDYAQFVYYSKYWPFHPIYMDGISEGSH